MANRPLAERIVRGGFRAIADECISRFGSYSFSGRYVPNPLAPHLPLMILPGWIEDLELLPPAIYATEIPDSDIVNVFARFAVSANRVRKEPMREHVMAVCPTLPTADHGVRAVLQLLVVAGMDPRRIFQVTNRTARLLAPCGQFLVTQNALEWPGGRRRLEKPLRFNLRPFLYQPMPPERFMHSGLHLLKLLLAKKLPHRREVIELLAMGAQSLGTEMSDEMVSYFDLQVGEESDPMDLILGVDDLAKKGARKPKKSKAKAPEPAKENTELPPPAVLNMLKIR